MTTERQLRHVKAVLGAIQEIAGPDGIRYETGTMIRIADLAGVSQSSVRKYVRALEALKVVEVVRVPERSHIPKLRPSRVLPMLRVLQPDATIAVVGGYLQVVRRNHE